MFYKGVPTLGQVDSEFWRWRRWTDLASAYVLYHLISSGPVFQSSSVRTTAGRMEVQSILDWRVLEGLVSKRIVLSQYLNWLYYTLVAHFYNYWEQCRDASAARGDVKWLNTTRSWSGELELTEGTWLQLMCCAPSRLRCPKFWVITEFMEFTMIFRSTPEKTE